MKDCDFFVLFCQYPFNKIVRRRKRKKKKKKKKKKCCNNNTVKQTLK